MVEELKLPNYDTALDSVDYSDVDKEGNPYAPRDFVQWPWKSDPERQKKRLNAVRKLLDAKAFYSLNDILKRHGESVVVIGWDHGYDEYAENIWNLKR